MLDAVHAGRELGWKSGHLEPFSFLGTLFRRGLRKRPLKSIRSVRAKASTPHGRAPANHTPNRKHGDPSMIVGVRPGNQPAYAITALREAT